MEDNIVENSTDDEGLVCEVSEGISGLARLFL